MITSDEQKILSWIKEQQNVMQQTLEKWSNINSYTFNITGLQQLSELITTEFATLDLNIQQVSLPALQTLNSQGNKYTQKLAPALHMQRNNTATINLLFCGHIDTVYPTSSNFNHCKLLDPQHLNGPGVVDMKSGIIIMLYVLRALQSSKYAKKFNIEVVINTDEEIGSPSSTPLLQECAKRNDLGLIFEPALNQRGTIVAARKGSCKYTIIARGKKAHAGRAFTQGRNAIVGLANVIKTIDSLNNSRSGLTLNVGEIQGGTAANVVPDFAICKIDVRLQKIQDQLWVEQQILKIIDQTQQQQQINLELHPTTLRPPKVITSPIQHLLNSLQKVAFELNTNLTWRDAGGVCDGNTLAHAGLPVIDSVGACGENIHSEQETLWLPSLNERTQLITLFLMRLIDKKI